jgi:hypothetical protein
MSENKIRVSGLGTLDTDIDKGSIFRRGMRRPEANGLCVLTSSHKIGDSQ